MIIPALRNIVIKGIRVKLRGKSPEGKARGLAYGPWWTLGKYKSIEYIQSEKSGVMYRWDSNDWHIDQWIEEE